MSILAEEHRTILSIVRNIEREQSKVLSDHAKNEMMKLVEFLHRHIAKEEQVLFPVLSRRLGMDRAVVNVLHSEHEVINADLSNITERLSKPSSLSDPLFTKMQSALRMLRVHMSKEDNVLFWLAEIKIPQHLYDILIRQMDAIDQKQITSYASQ